MHIGFNKKTIKGITHLTIPAFEDTGVVNHLFSTRSGGVSEGPLSSMNLGFNRGDKRENVEENFKRICSLLDVSYNSLVLSGQTHTNNVISVSREDRGKGITRPSFKDVDGLITDSPDVTLCTFYADCTPLFFLDPVKKVVALSHSGWKGTVKKISAVTVEKMVNEYGCEKENILVAIGPCAGPCCYEVSDEVAMEILRAGDNGDCIRYNNQTKKLHADLWQTNYRILLNAGIPDDNITIARECTVCNPIDYFSHRRQGAERGSLAAFITLREDYR